MGERGPEMEVTRNLGPQAKNSDSMTHNIFHGDKIYFKNGNMAFKPLGMETVLESTEEARVTLNDVKWMQKMQTNASQRDTPKRYQ